MLVYPHIRTSGSSKVSIESSPAPGSAMFGTPPVVHGGGVRCGLFFGGGSPSRDAVATSACSLRACFDRVSSSFMSLISGKISEALGIEPKRSRGDVSLLPGRPKLAPGRSMNTSGACCPPLLTSLFPQTFHLCASITAAKRSRLCRNTCTG